MAIAPPRSTASGTKAGVRRPSSASVASERPVSLSNQCDLPGTQTHDHAMPAQPTQTAADIAAHATGGRSANAPRRASERLPLCGRQPVHQAIRGLAERFEHRLFLSATPHNGRSNSFSALLEILDPQRFTAGVPVKPRELDPVMVRRLKSDLRYFGAKFPERKVEPLVIRDLPQDVAELALSRMCRNMAKRKWPASRGPMSAVRARNGYRSWVCNSGCCPRSPPSPRPLPSIAKGWSMRKLRVPRW